jgi:DNA gyrase subunit A
MLAISNNRPKIMNLKQLLRCFVDHRFEVITRRTQFDLRKAEERRHILEGLRIALDHLDTVVRIIRECRNRDEARERLMSTLALSERQTNAILEMRLYQLTGLERDKVEEEYLKLLETIAYLQGLLDHPERIYGLIKDDMADLKQRYGDARRTQIVQVEGEVNIEDLIADEGCVVTLSHQGYIKRVPLTTYREQRRGGRGVKGATTKEEDFVENLFVCTTHDKLLFFTSDGRMYAEKAYEIPEAERTSRGKAIVNLLNLREDEKIAAFIKIREFREDQYVVMATEQGVIKKTCLADYRNVRNAGIIAINIDEGNRLIGVRLTGGDDQVMLVTANGMSIRFHENDLRDLGRAARGVRGIDLGDGDRVVSLTTVQPDATVLVCCEKGYGKRTDFENYRLQSRGGKGIRTIVTSERNGCVVFADTVHDADALMLITSNGILIRTGVDEIRQTGRVAQGVRLINLDDDDKLISASVIKPEDDEVDPRDLEGSGVGGALAGLTPEQEPDGEAAAAWTAEESATDESASDSDAPDAAPPA